MGLTAIAHWLLLGPGTLDVPSFLAFGFSLMRLLPALNQVYAGHAYITPLLASLESVTRWLDLPRFPSRPFGKLVASELKQGIEFENVSLTYGNGAVALRDFSFFLPAGETLAILGASGSGKSSLASLVLRLREPTSGRILFDGVDHRDFDAESFSRTVAFVEQDPFLFNLSIAENVVCGRTGIERAAVLESLRVVRLAEVVERLPQGVDTVLAERGATLSGGQRQRLAIARAVVGNPHVLVLDEPTSALDPDTEQEVVKAIDAASVGRTTIIITHRVSTVEHATRRLHLADGRIEPFPERTASAKDQLVADRRG
jgi:ABC-type multidrug transport system fused ATPase/permease subunit